MFYLPGANQRRFLADIDERELGCREQIQAAAHQPKHAEQTQPEARPHRDSQKSIVSQLSRDSTQQGHQGCSRERPPSET